MKNKILLILFVLSFGWVTQQMNAQTSITLTNSNTFDRIDELVEVRLSEDVYKSLSKMVLVDNEDNAIPYQVLPYENKIVFQATVLGSSTKEYTLKEGTPITAETKTYAAIKSPTSRADIAWENDRTAYRMYSRKLLTSDANTSNGVDLWVKKVPQPIIDKMYTYADYHSEKLEGVDAYNVNGKTLGAGGVVAYVNNKLWLHDPYDECEIITNGPLRSEFVLTYKKVLIDGDYYTKTLRVTTNANGLINKAVVKFEGKIKPMKMAVGIFLHTGTQGNQYAEGNIIAYAENKSEGTVTSTGARFYNGVYMPGEVSKEVVDNQRIIYVDYVVGSELTYYFGGGWNIFPQEEYFEDADWFDAMVKFADCVKNPMLGDKNALPDKKTVINEAVRVNNYWIGGHLSELGDNKWARSVYNMGNIDFYKVYPDPLYLERATQWAQSHSWGINGGSSTRDADNHTAGQTYIDLYLMDEEGKRDANKIKGIKAALDYRITNNKTSDDWWWIDAMLMAMPAYTRLGVVYNDTKYFDKMYALFANIRDKIVVNTPHTSMWPQNYRTKYGAGPILTKHSEFDENIQYEGLYSVEDHLWWRDWGFQPNVPPKRDPNAEGGAWAADAPKLSPNGKKIYWSRGNGWVLAAMVRVLDLLPETDTHRDEYIAVFKQMSAVLKDCQREDGFWNMNLGDPDHFPGQETSGTALFTYGMAWGINNGLLDEETYYPVVAKGWNALCRYAVTTGGKLTKTQNVGEGPIDPNRLASNVDFGVGAFLLAASEVVKLAEGEMPQAPEPAAISFKSITATTTTVLVEFDQDLDAASAKIASNYMISDGVVVTKAELSKSNSVLLTLKNTLPYGRYTLIVNDIKNASGATIPENTSKMFILPVPMSDVQKEIKITAIGYQTGNPPGNVMDKNLATRWSQQGRTGQWIKFDMGEEVMINAIDIAFYLGHQRVAYFDLDASSDDKTFTPILSELTSSGETQNMERYSFEPVKARYIRIICNSNSAGGEHWNSITEARVQYEKIVVGIEDVNVDQRNIVIYPNPVTNGQLVVDFNDNINEKVCVNIYDTAGNKVFDQKMDAVAGKIEIDNIQLQKGSYVISIKYGKETISRTFLVK
ncbi:glycoside hydrolase family 88 protein [Bacteroidales bacterium OttesenSCG-928-M06]|nr:glycoside hydrolase family 88 protein [Bacteroidales bacterium OttesenSCG-928-M06]